MIRAIKLALLAGVALLALTTGASAEPVSIALAAVGNAVISGLTAVGLGSLLPVGSSAAIGAKAIGLALQIGGAVYSLTRKPQVTAPGEIKVVVRPDESPEYEGLGRTSGTAVTAFGNYRRPYVYRNILHRRGPIDATEDYFLNGREVIVDDDGKVLSQPWGGTPVYDESGEPAPAVSRVVLYEKPGEEIDEAWPQLVAAIDGYTLDHIVPGIAQTLMVIDSPDISSEGAAYQQIFADGPEIRLRKTTRDALVYDPRKDSTVAGGFGTHRAADETTWEWTENGILCSVHAHRRIYGFAATEYNWTRIAAQADLADEPVDIPGGTEPRSVLGGIFAIEGERLQTMRTILDSAGVERVTDDDGRYWFRLIDDAPTPEIEFTADDIYRLEVSSGPEAVERPNYLRIKHMSSARDYVAAEIPLHEYDFAAGEIAAPWARIDAEVTRYGVKPMDLEFLLCPSPFQAQRIGRQKFEMARADAGSMWTDMQGFCAFGLSTTWIWIDGEKTRCRIDAVEAVRDGDGDRVRVDFTCIPEMEAFGVRPDFAPSLDFSNPLNSQYLFLLAA